MKIEIPIRRSKRALFSMLFKRKKKKQFLEDHPLVFVFALSSLPVFEPFHVPSPLLKLDGPTNKTNRKQRRHPKQKDKIISKFWNHTFCLELGSSSSTLRAIATYFLSHSFSTEWASLFYEKEHYPSPNCLPKHLLLLVFILFHSPKLH